MNTRDKKNEKSEQGCHQRVMLKFSKQGALRWISHLDTMHTLEKALRRAELPVALSQGFNPHQKMSLAVPLSVGVPSCGEYLELELNTRLEPLTVLKHLNAVLPENLRILGARELPKKTPSLMALVELSRYRVTLPQIQAVPTLPWPSLCNELLAERQLLVKRTNKQGKETEIDIRPGLLVLCCVSEDDANGQTHMELVIETGSRLFVRVQEVLDLLCDRAGLAHWQPLAAEPERLDLGVRMADNFCSLMDYDFVKR